MPRNKRSFLERLTGIVETDNDYDEYDEFDRYDEFDAEDDMEEDVEENFEPNNKKQGNWMDDDTSEGELMVDVYQTDRDIVIQTMVAGVPPEDLDISISKEIVTIKGKREEPQGVNEEDYFHHELYWGPFSRTILLPQEIEADEAEAMEKYGLLMIRLPKVDKERTKQIRVKSI